MRTKIAVYGGAVLLAFPISLFLHAPIAQPQERPVPVGGVTRENFLRLHEGLTREQVEEIMGGPPKACYQSSGTHSLVWHGQGINVSIDYAGDKGAIGGLAHCSDGTEIELQRKPKVESWWTIILRKLRQ
jgi:hypothetical protein